MTGRADRHAERAGWGGRIVSSVALFLVALGVRALPAPTVLLDDGVQPFGGDAFYHLRRIAYAIEHFPDVLGFDRYLNFPTGAAAIWTPAFDGFVAALAVVFRAEAASPAMERIAVWVPPALGAATVVVLYHITARRFGEWTGRVAGAIGCVLSGHFWYSQIGFVDHHVAIAFVTTLLLGAAWSYLEASDGRRRTTGVALGVSIGAALLVWPGTLLHVGIVEAVLVASLIHDPGERRSASALRFASVQALALIVVWPWAASNDWPQWGAFSPVVLSRFHVWWFGALGVFGIVCALIWRRDGAGARAGPRFFSAVLAASGVAIISALVWPMLLDGVADALQWFGRDERFQAMVSESMPLFSAGGDASIDVAVVRLSPFLFVSPLALFALARSARTNRQPQAIGLVVAWTTLLLLATLVQKRFFNTSSLALALLMAWSFDAIAREWASRGRASVRTARVWAVVAIGVVLAPVLASYRGYWANWREHDAIAASRLQLEQNVAIALARYLRQTTPPTAGWLDASAAPEYGVMAPWPIGHVIEYVARRPSVTSGFGDDVGTENFAAARRYYLGGEREALAIAEALSVRYVISQRSDTFLGEPALPESMLSALFARDGSAADGSPALTRHRLLYESAPPGSRERHRQSLFKVFEVVRGAELVGRVRRGARVEARLSLTTNRSREFAYASAGRVGHDGAYRLRVPYSTSDSPGVVRSGPGYRIRCGAGEVEVAVPESAVRAGSVIEVPEIDCAPPPGNPK